MDLALKTAENAGKAGEVPIGCVMVRDYEVIATAGNRTLTDYDPTAHAEILAIRRGGRRRSAASAWSTATSTSRWSPAPCVRARSRFARISRLYYGAADPKGGAVEFRRAVLCLADLPSCAGCLFRRSARARRRRLLKEFSSGERR